MTRPRPWINVQVDGVNHAAWAAGPGAYAMIVAAGGRPLWSRRRKSWATSETTAIDVIAMAEHEGYAIRYQRLDRDADDGR